MRIADSHSRCCTRCSSTTAGRCVRTYVAMATDAPDARTLLQVAPDQYVAERTRLMKEARAEGERARAGFYQSLKHPNLSLWAVLAAGDDAAAVRGIVAATTELAKVQARGSSSGALSTATKERRKSLEALVDRAVAALAQWERGAEARRAEIRSVIDQLSRHADVVEGWIDGTLRDLPDDAWGFGAFTNMEVTPATQSAEARTKKAKPGAGARKATTAEPDEVAPPLPSRAARAERTRQARQEVAAAKRDLAAAERRVDVAKKAVREAEKEVRLAQGDQAAAEKRLEQATADLVGAV
jgi:hypothetical protein